jgi:hypothetical protein
MVKKEFIPVQVTAEQKEIIKKKAKEKGLTMAGYIRYVAIYSELSKKES